MKLEHITKPLDAQLKIRKLERKHDSEDNVLSTINGFKNQEGAINNTYDTCRKLASEQNEMYKSILKSKRTEFQDSIKKVNNEVMDKLIAQVVVRAQKLRGAMLKETYNENDLDFSSNSLSGIPIEDQIRLHEYFSDKDIGSYDKHKALCTLTSTSSTSSLIDLASGSFKSYEYDNKEITPNNIFSLKTNTLSERERLLKEKLCTKQRGL